MTSEEAMYSNITAGQLLRDLFRKFAAEFTSNGISGEASKISHQAAVVEEAIMACKCTPQQERIHEKSLDLLTEAMLLIEDGSFETATHYIAQVIAAIANETNWRPLSENQREVVEDAIEMFNANP